METRQSRACGRTSCRSWRRRDLDPDLVRPPRRTAGGGERVVPANVLPVLTPLAVDPGHRSRSCRTSRSTSRRGEESRDGRGEVRAREGPRRASTVRAAPRGRRGEEEDPTGEGRVPLLESLIQANLPSSSPASRSSRRTSSGHPRRRHRDPGGRGLRPPRDDRAGGPAPPLRRRRPAGSRPKTPKRVGSSSSSSSRSPRATSTRWKGRSTRRPDVAPEAGPPRPEGPALHARASPTSSPPTLPSSRRSARGHPPPPPLRLLRRSSR